MKKNILFCLILLTNQFNSSAQVNDHALGVRFGSGNFGSGAELSYQMGLSEKNRLELDLGWKGNNGNGNGAFNGYQIVLFSAIYQWDWNITDGFNWYVGPGAQIGFWKWKNNGPGYDDGLIFAVGGQIGIEYDFSENQVPLLISLDTRPMWGFNQYDGFGYGGALSLRYIFE